MNSAPNPVMIEREREKVGGGRVLWVGLEAEGDVTVGTVLFLCIKIPANSIIFSITHIEGRGGGRCYQQKQIMVVPQIPSPPPPQISPQILNLNLL